MSSEPKYAMTPWEYNDPEKFEQGHGKYSETAIYARGNAFPWRMAEIQGPDRKTEIATARLMAAAPELLDSVREFVAAAELTGVMHDGLRNRVERARAAIAKAEGQP